MAKEHERRQLPHPGQLTATSARSYYAEVSTQFLAAHAGIIDRLIEFAFGDLEARHLELRVVEARACCGKVGAGELAC